MNPNLLAAASNELAASLTNIVSTNQLPPGGAGAGEPFAYGLAWMVWLGAALTTFVASVVGDEQNERLKNGTLGTVAGSALGGIAALLKNQQELLVVGFFGSAVGALLGWLAVLILSYNARTKDGRNWLEYYVGGFKGLRDRLALDDQDRLVSGLASWVAEFSVMIEGEKRETLSAPAASTTNVLIKTNLQSWLSTLANVLALVFATLANKPQYRSRVAIIVFGKEAGKVRGRIWLSHVGSLDPYRPVDLDETSIAWKVVGGSLVSPHFCTKAKAKQDGQDRGREEYRPFYTFRLTGDAAFIMDWPEDVAKDDPFVQVATNLVKANLGPAMTALLAHWTGEIAEQVKLETLVPKVTVTLPVPNPAAAAAPPPPALAP